MKVRIYTRPAGQAFAVYAVVKSGHKAMHVTRDYPWGMTNVAYTAAADWAAAQGHTVGYSDSYNPYR